MTSRFLAFSWRGALDTCVYHSFSYHLHPVLLVYKILLLRLLRSHFASKTAVFTCVGKIHVSAYGRGMIRDDLMHRKNGTLGHLNLSPHFPFELTVCHLNVRLYLLHRL